MIRSILKRDLVRNKAINIALMLFLTLSAFLMASGTMIIMQLMGSIDGLFEVAQPPHFLQMHKGEIDQQKIDDFANNVNYVVAEETVDMINIDGASIWYLKAGNDISEKITMVDNMMDNGFVKQNKKLDFLVDLDNEIIKLNDGEIAVPTGYMQKYDLEIGDKVIISEGEFYKEFVITEFARDAQMASSMASSTRFLVSDHDLDLLKENVGQEEYIIEFRLIDSELIKDFETLYESEEAGMPTNGQAITYPLIKLVDAIGDGLVAIVIILVSLLLICIAMLNLRFTILATLEEEVKEIGTMKAIGIANKDIKKLYLIKYRLLAIGGCILGYIVSIPASNWFTQNMAITFGRVPLTLGSFIIPILSTVVVYLLVVYFCKKILKKIEHITVVEALVHGVDEKKKKKVQETKMLITKNRKAPMNVYLGIREIYIKFRTWLLLLFVFVLATCIMVIPMNLFSTFEDPTFALYMGSPLSDIRIDLAAQEGLLNKNAEVINILENDSTIDHYSIFGTCKYEAYGEEWDALSVECGEYSVFNVLYDSGRPPQQEGEIAFSTLNAQKFNKVVGDSLKLRIDGNEIEYTVCGIYQDITSGGYTAKMMYDYNEEDVLGYTYFINLNDKTKIDKVVTDYNAQIPYAKVLPSEEFMYQTLSSIEEPLSQAVWVTICMAIFITALITVLFLKLQAAKTYSQIVVLKAVGFSTSDIRKQYLVKSCTIVIIGIIIGLVISNTLGESLVGGLISMVGMGMTKIDFIVNPLQVYLMCPSILLIICIIATWLCSSEVKRYNIVQLLSE